ncbi:MAG: hypothetical protein M3Q33_02195 [Acidobacteriota bacterium]|nr:hypothetical protein [Acidobacteriota bacterium]
MKLKEFKCFGLLLAIVLFSYGAANSQVVDAVKDAAKKTKDVTVDAAKKTAEVTTDIADKTKDVTVNAAKKTADVAGDVKDAAVDGAKAAGSGTKKVGGYVIEKTGDIAEKSAETGKYFVVTTWDGTKWVSKKVWFATKKAADKTKDVVIGEDEVKP